MSKDKELVVGHYRFDYLGPNKIIVSEHTLNKHKWLKAYSSGFIISKLIKAKPKRSKRGKKSESKNKKGE